MNYIHVHVIQLLFQITGILTHLNFHGFLSRTCDVMTLTSVNTQTEGGVAMGVGKRMLWVAFVARRRNALKTN